MEIVFKTLLVFIHFICATLALSSILNIYFKFSFFYNKPLTKNFISQLEFTKKQIILLLYALWISGILLCIYGYATNFNFFNNPKLIAKIIVVLILTFNGILTHKYLNKYLQENMILVNINKNLIYKFSLIASVSFSSWLFACFLGVARSWNNTLDLSTIMYIYLTLLLFTSLIILYSMKNIINIQKYYLYLGKFITYK